MITNDIGAALRAYGRPDTRRLGLRSGFPEAQRFIYGVATDAARRVRWNEVIALLRKWAAKPEDLEDEGVKAPTSTLILHAVSVAGAMRETKELPAPRRVTPTNEGGLLFERWDGDLAEVLEFLQDGSCEMKTFYRDRLVQRVPLHLVRPSRTL